MKTPSHAEPHRDGREMLSGQRGRPSRVALPLAPHSPPPGLLAGRGNLLREDAAGSGAPAAQRRVPALPAGEAGRAISRGGVVGSSPGAYPGGAGSSPALREVAAWCLAYPMDDSDRRFIAALRTRGLWREPKEETNG